MSEAPPRARHFRTWLVPALGGLLFALLSMAVLPHPGFEDDEVAFTGPIYSPALAEHSITVWGTRVPLMVLSYYGALKTWIYAGLFEFFAPSVWSVRLPMVLVGVVTLWLTWMWTRRVAGTRAAAFAVALLSTDSIFILTNTFDWGPVAFQHVFLMGGLLAVQFWLENDSKRSMLALGFFLWGLGLWDKALLVWPLGGLAVAALCVYPRQLLRRSRPLPIGIAIASLLIGALPLVVYNVARHGATASGNTKLSLDRLSGKLPVLEVTLDGSGLLDSMVATTPGPIAQTPKTLAEGVSVAVARLAGRHTHNLMIPAIALSLLAAVFLLGTPQFRLLVFILIAICVAWLQMALNAGTGGSEHHTILLWPLPCIFVGIALAGVADRGPRPVALAMNGLIALIAFAGLLNTNEYIADLTRYGGVKAWTDASYRLPGAISPYRSDWIGGVDWGYLNGLQMRYEGQLKLFTASDDLGKPVMSEEGKKQWLTMTSRPDFVFIQHTAEDQIVPGVNGQFRDAALALGYTEHLERTVHDNQGRPVFEIFRFVKTRTQ